MFCRVSLYLMFVLFCIGYHSTWASDSPNVIVMMADDMGTGDTSAYQDITGNSDSEQIFTPSMERLARMGIRFSDAHTPSSRCSPTRYGLLTGRYPWRNRLKHWVLFGAQGDPMIESDRPTLGTIFQSAGYKTAMVGKWHVGLRYRQSNGMPAAEFTDADLRQPLLDTPLDHGFDACWFTSRSHGTSGPQPNTPKNKPEQTVGPGHINGRTAMGATENGRKLTNDRPHAYILEDLGKRHSDTAMDFLSKHVAEQATRERPFFLYYPSNSNHTPHTPSDIIGEQPVARTAKSVAGQAMDRRSDYVYENDVALGRLLDWLEQTDDPRSSGRKLIENTLVIFTSDNGAEKNSNVATGPFRSNKGSVYEGGHRVPFIAACPAVGIGDGDPKSTGITSDQLVCLTDLFATFCELTGQQLPNLKKGEKGGEDSLSILPALRGESLPNRPLFFHDHKEASDHAASAIRLDNPEINGKKYPGQWKLFFDSQLLRFGRTQTVELFDLATDSVEKVNRIDDPDLEPLIRHLEDIAATHRNSGGHRYVPLAGNERIRIEFTEGKEVTDDSAHLTRINAFDDFDGKSTSGISLPIETDGAKKISFRLQAETSSTAAASFHLNPRGLGVTSGKFAQVDSGERLLISFDHDVIIESVGIVAGNGTCGGSYQVGDKSPLAIYCVDADIDAQDQSGLLSDIGLLRKGEHLKLDSAPRFGVESPGQWRLQSVTFRLGNDVN